MDRVLFTNVSVIDGILCDLLRAQGEIRVDQGGHVILAHRVHRHERQRQIAGLGIRHRLDVLAETLHSARHRVKIALNLQQRQEAELHG